MKESFEWNPIDVTSDKVVPDVERRQSVAKRRIDRIDFFSEVRGVVHCLAVSVPSRQVQPSADMTQANLQCVVVGFSSCCLIGVAPKARSQRASGPVNHLA